MRQGNLVVNKVATPKGSHVSDRKKIKNFLHKTSYFLEFFVSFRAVIFATQENKEYLKKNPKKPTDPTWKVRPPGKRAFLFFSFFMARF